MSKETNRATAEKIYNMYAYARAFLSPRSDILERGGRAVLERRKSERERRRERRKVRVRVGQRIDDRCLACLRIAGSDAGGLRRVSAAKSDREEEEAARRRRRREI